MTRANPINKIDSLDDMISRTDMKFFSAQYEPLSEYAENFKNSDPKAQDLFERLKLFPREHLLRNEFKLNLTEDINSRSFGFITNRLSAIFLALHLYDLNMRYNRTKIAEQFREGIHVSKDGDGYLPYFMGYNEDTVNTFIKKGMNQM